MNPWGHPITQALEINARSSDVIFITIFSFQDLFGAAPADPPRGTLEVFRKQQSPLGIHSGVTFLGFSNRRRGIDGWHLNAVANCNVMLITKVQFFGPGASYHILRP